MSSHVEFLLCFVFAKLTSKETFFVVLFMPLNLFCRKVGHIFVTNVTNRFPKCCIPQHEKAKFTLQMWEHVFFKMIFYVFFTIVSSFLYSSKFDYFYGYIPGCLYKFAIMKVKVFFNFNVFFLFKIIWMCYPMFLALT